MATDDDHLAKSSFRELWPRSKDTYSQFRENTNAPPFPRTIRQSPHKHPEESLLDEEPPSVSNVYLAIPAAYNSTQVVAGIDVVNQTPNDIVGDVLEKMNRTVTGEEQQKRALEWLSGKALRAEKLYFHDSVAAQTDRERCRQLEASINPDDTSKKEELKALIEFDTQSGNWGDAEKAWQLYLQLFPSSSSYLECAKWAEDNAESTLLARSVFESMMQLNQHELKQPWVLEAWATFEERHGEHERAYAIRTELAQLTGPFVTRMDSILPKPVFGESLFEKERTMCEESNEQLPKVASTSEAVASASDEKERTGSPALHVNPGTKSQVPVMEVSQSSIYVQERPSLVIEKQQPCAEQEGAEQEGAEQLSVARTEDEKTTSPSIVSGNRDNQFDPPSTYRKSRIQPDPGTSGNPFTIAIAAAGLLSALTVGTFLETFNIGTSDPQQAAALTSRVRAFPSEREDHTFAEETAQVEEMLETSGQSEDDEDTTKSFEIGNVQSTPPIEITSDKSDRFGSNKSDKESEVYSNGLDHEKRTPSCVDENNVNAANDKPRTNSVDSNMLGLNGQYGFLFRSSDCVEKDVAKDDSQQFTLSSNSACEKEGGVVLGSKKTKADLTETAQNIDTLHLVSDSEVEAFGPKFIAMDTDFPAPFRSMEEVRLIDFETGITIGRVESDKIPGSSMASTIEEKNLRKLEDEIEKPFKEQASLDDQVKYLANEMERKTLEFDQSEINQRRAEEIKEKLEDQRIAAEKESKDKAVRLKKMELDRKVQDELEATQKQDMRELEVRKAVEEKMNTQYQLQAMIEKAKREEDLRKQRETELEQERKMAAAESAQREIDFQKKLERERILVVNMAAEENAKLKTYFEKKLDAEQKLAAANAERASALEKELEDNARKLRDERSAAADERAKMAEDLRVQEIELTRRREDLRIKEMELQRKVDEQFKAAEEKARKEEIRASAEEKLQEAEALQQKLLEELQSAIEKAKREEDLRRQRETELEQERKVAAEESAQREIDFQKKLDRERIFVANMAAEEITKSKVDFEKKLDAEKKLGSANAERASALEKELEDIARRLNAEQSAAADETAKMVEEVDVQKEGEGKPIVEKAENEHTAEKAEKKSISMEKTNIAISALTPPEETRTRTSVVPVTTNDSIQFSDFSSELINTGAVVAVLSGLATIGFSAVSKISFEAGSETPPEIEGADLEETRNSVGLRRSENGLKRSGQDQKPITNASKEGDALLQLVLFETRCRRFDRAEDAFNQYVKQFPSVSAYLRFAEWAENDAENIDLARSVFESILKVLNPQEVDQASVFKQWAAFEKRQGEIERAQILYRGELEKLDIYKPKARRGSASNRGSSTFTGSAAKNEAESNSNIMGSGVTHSFEPELRSNGAMYEPYPERLDSYRGSSISDRGSSVSNRGSSTFSEDPNTKNYRSESNNNVMGEGIVQSFESKYSQSGYQPFSNRVPGLDGRGAIDFTPDENITDDQMSAGKVLEGASQNQGTSVQRKRHVLSYNHENADLPFRNNRISPGDSERGAGAIAQNRIEHEGASTEAAYDSNTGNPALTRPFGDSSQAQQFTARGLLKKVPSKDQSAQEPQVPAQPTVSHATNPVTANVSPPTVSTTTFNAPSLEARMEQLNSELRSMGIFDESDESEEAVALAQQALYLADEAMKMTDSSSPDLTEEMAQAYAELSQLLAEGNKANIPNNS